jgi:hypothetical protein
MAIDTRTRRVMAPITRHPEDLAADARIREALRKLPASVLRQTDWHLWDGRAGEVVMRDELARLGVTP